MVHKTYIWLQLCQILTDFNNFALAKPEKCTKQGMQRVYHSIAARASDLRVVRNGPVCCEPRHTIDEWRRCLSACVDAKGGLFEHYLW